MRRAVHLVVAGLVAAALAPGGTPAVAWGDAGHRIVGEVAWQLMDAPTREAVRALMTERGYRTLAQSGTWADRVGRRDPAWDWLAPYHYVNVATGSRRYVAERDCAEGRCAIGGVERFARTLADRDAGRDERVLALRMIAHLVGDLHQPLHVTDADARGGNRTHVRYAGEPVTLHALWDTSLVEAAVTDAERRTATEGWRALAAELAADAAGRAPRRRGSLDPEDWGNESLRLYRRRARGIEPGTVIDDAWVRRQLPVVRDRLTWAGLRLAELLERVVEEAR